MLVMMLLLLLIITLLLILVSLCTRWAIEVTMLSIWKNNA
jgi:hypothetical protein